jgi:hypothetical protein
MLPNDFKLPDIEHFNIEHFKLPDPEKKGIMCTECKKVYWGAVSSVDKCRCGDTDPNHRINVSSADFNKYSGRFLREDDLKKWLTSKRGYRCIR